MAYIICDELWRSGFCNKVSAKDRLQDVNLNLPKLKVNDSYKRDEKITTKIEALEDEDNKNKAYLNTKFEVEGHISYIE